MLGTNVPSIRPFVGPMLGRRQGRTPGRPLDALPFIQLGARVTEEIGSDADRGGRRVRIVVHTNAISVSYGCRCPRPR
jgi:hypothetical protein